MTESSEHDIEIYKEGYRSVSRKIFVAPGRTFHMKHTLEKLSPGEPEPSPPVPPQRTETRGERDRRRTRERDPSTPATPEC